MLLVALAVLCSLVVYLLIEVSSLKRDKTSLEKEKTNLFNTNEDLEKKNEKLSNENNSLTDVRERYKDVLDLEGVKIGLRSEVENLEDDIKEKKESALKVLSAKEKLEKEISILEEDLSLQEFSLYKPKYQFEDIEEYKIRLDDNKDSQKLLIKKKTAVICHTEWQVSGSAAKGKTLTNNIIKLALRAFNGECDAAIAKVKYNNVHVMEKRINKSFGMINKMIAHFACEIQPVYLKLKIQELELTHEYHEALQAEKEEQRRIKEQIREEERAQKEFEKAQREAEKEQTRAEQALEKARKELGEAHGAKVDKLKEKLALLEKQLEEAKNNKERAKSMAQITKSGHVYVISNLGSFGENVYKIGMTRRLEPMDRVRELGDASVPFKFDVHAMIYSENAPELENTLHKQFDHKRLNKVNLRREFFKTTLEEIKEIVEKHHGKINFTKLAEAEEYRKSLAMERETEKLQQKKHDIQKEAILAL